jgi:hypothetical protein
LYRHLDYLRGMRGAVERAAMRLPAQWSTVRDVVEPEVLAALVEIRRAAGGIASCLLLWTGYYKQTSLVGIVRTTNSLEFVKVFGSQADAVDEEHRLAALRALVPENVRLAEIRRRTGGVISYRLLRRSRRPVPAAALREIALDIGARALAEGGHEVSGLRDLAALGVVEEVCGSDTSSLVERNVHGGLMATAHGDFTAWNTFRSLDGRVCLIDYDAVSLRPPFFDAVHFATQGPALAGRSTSLLALTRSIADRAGASSGTARTWVRGCLADAVLEAATAYQAYPANRHRTGVLLRSRVGMLVADFQP